MLRQSLINPSAAVAAASVAGFFAAASAHALCAVDGGQGTPNPIDADVTWPTGLTADDGTDCEEVVLYGRVFVTTGATLTILPGTVVRGESRTGQPEDTDGNVFSEGAPGALIITRSGYIDSAGGPTSPVIMTTAVTDNDGDLVPDDFNDDGFFDPYPGFTTSGCTCDGQPGAGETAPAGVDACLGDDGLPGTADDTLGTCELAGGDSQLPGFGSGCPAAVAGSCDASVVPELYDDTPATNPLAPLNPTTGVGNIRLWGGLIVLGQAGTNLGTGQPGPQQGLIEGLTLPGDPVAFGTYGGTQALDSSGSIAFTSIRHGGDELGDGNEINGLTLGGVGLGTDIHHVEVYLNQDDGIEFFGGTASANYIAVAMAGDDQFDLDQGYIGFNQFWFTVMPFFNELDGGTFGPESGEKMGEWDGDDSDVTRCGKLSESSIAPPFSQQAPCPMHSAVVYNFTGIGNDLDSLNQSIPPATGPGASFVTAEFDPNVDGCGGASPPACCGSGTCTAPDSIGVEMRNGFAGQVRNSIIVNTGDQQPLVVVDSGAATGYRVGENICSHDGATGGDQGTNPVGYGEMVRVMSSTLADGALLPGFPNSGPDSQDCVGDESDAVVNGDEYALEVLNEAGSARNCVDGVEPPSIGTGGDRRINNGSIPGAFPGLINEDTTFDPTGVNGKLLGAKTTPIDPRPARGSGPGNTQCVVTVSDVEHPIPEPSFGFRGAFPRGDDDLWTTGWTALNTGGVLAD